MLNCVASSVSAGIDPMIALACARDYFPGNSVIGGELQAFYQNLQKGLSEEECLAQFCGSISNFDIGMFKACMRLSKRHGSGISDPLRRITKVVRRRQSFRRKTRAALTMHRMSAIGITVCALLIVGIQASMNIAAFQNALYHPTGGKVIAFGAALIMLGIMWMLSLGKMREQ